MKSYALREPMSAKERKDLEAYPELLQELLFYRGITSGREAETFLKPDFVAHTHDPFLMKDMDKAVARILKAIEKNEPMLIYTDYDADGIPAGVILHDFFRKIGFTNFVNYFPHRHDEGFGLHKAAVEKFAKKDAYEKGPFTLLLTADCGIADFDAVVRANELGIDVIISDHHMAPEKVPPAFAILNPKQEGCTYPYNMLCGSGVAFKLVQAILQKNNFGMKEGMEKWFLDMVGLATLADMVPLKGENRVFAHYGLTVLRKSPRLGLMKLLAKMKIDQRYLSEDDLGFMVVPRINAASRMGVPIDAFLLLTASDDVTADRLSDHLTSLNDERKSAAAVITKEAKKHIADRLAKEGGGKSGKDSERKPVLVMGNPNWKPAMLGPVANSLMEAYHVPVFLWGRADEEVLKGSSRSDGLVSVVELLETVEKLGPGTLLGFGGHRASGGFSISHEKIHLLEEALIKAYEHLYADGTAPVAAPVQIDRKLILDDVNWQIYGLIEKLSPFGEGNPKPLFLFENAQVAGMKQFGKEKNHLELQFKKSDGRIIPAIGFFSTPEKFSVPIEKDGKINLVAVMEKSYFRNYPELRLRIIDIY